MTGFSFDNNRFAADTIRLPMMSLREVVMFPRSIAPLFVGREASIKAIEQAVAAALTQLLRNQDFANVLPGLIAEQERADLVMERLRALSP